MKKSIIVYGATGYTGKLVAEAAKKQGLNVILSGRNGGKLLEVAGPLGYEARTAHLEDAASLDALLKDAAVVVHIAGPFSVTSQPMVDACLRTGTHYLDITGEIVVFEACAARDQEAKRAGVMLLPGAGFDVVPSDCLAAHVAAKLPGATSLVLGIAGLGSASRGTLKTGVEGLARGTAVRQKGKIVMLKRPPERLLDFGEGPKPAVGVGWGDVATAYHTTGIPDIVVYFLLTGEMKRLMGLSRRFGWLLGLGPVKRALVRRIDSGPEGPSPAERAASPGIIVAEASDGQGRVARARLTTPNGYSLTAETALALARRAASGDVKAGYQTPARAYGADFVLGFEGVTRVDVA